MRKEAGDATNASDYTTKFRNVKFHSSDKHRLAVGQLQNGRGNEAQEHTRQGLKGSREKKKAGN